MPRPRKGNRILEASGAFQKDPARARQDPAPRAGNLGEPPDHLVDEERQAWQEIAHTAPEGLLTRSDRIAVELAARLLAKQRRGEAGPTDIGHLRSLLAKFGQTPGDRESMGRPNDHDRRNPFADLEPEKRGHGKG